MYLTGGMNKFDAQLYTSFFYFENFFYLKYSLKDLY